MIKLTEKKKKCQPSNIRWIALIQQWRFWEKFMQLEQAKDAEVDRAGGVTRMKVMQLQDIIAIRIKYECRDSQIFWGLGLNAHIFFVIFH